jgi:hypothetical protein
MSQTFSAVYPQQGLKISKVKNANDDTQHNSNYLNDVMSLFLLSNQVNNFIGF